MIGAVGTLFGLLIAVVFNEIDRLRARLYEVKQAADEAKDKSDRVDKLSSEVADLKIKLPGLEILKSDMRAHKADLSKVASMIERLEDAEDCKTFGKMKV